MKREQLEHLLRAAGAITQEDSIIVIGSQSILGAHPDAPDDLLESREADLFPRRDPSKGEILDAIGEDSVFDKTFGYYAQWVDETTATLPKGWKGRLIKICNENTGGVSGYCLEPLDLVASKLAAGREKDLMFVDAFIKHSLGTIEDIADRVRLLPSSGPSVRQPEEKILAWLGGRRASMSEPDRLVERKHTRKP